MLGDITAATDIYIICGYTDMRKSIDGLCAIIRDQLHFEPEHTTALYLFFGRRNDTIKALLHVNGGFVLLYKRLHHNTGIFRCFDRCVYIKAKKRHFPEGVSLSCH